MSEECIETRNGYFNVVNVESCTMKNVCIYVKHLEQENQQLKEQLNVYKAAIKEISEFVENLWNNNEEFAYTKYYSPNDAMVFGKLREMINKVKE